jgi:hypothetical protein
MLISENAHELSEPGIGLMQERLYHNDILEHPEMQDQDAYTGDMFGKKD